MKSQLCGQSLKIAACGGGGYFGMCYPGGASLAAS